MVGRFGQKVRIRPFWGEGDWLAGFLRLECRLRVAGWIIFKRFFAQHICRRRVPNIPQFSLPRDHQAPKIKRPPSCIPPKIPPPRFHKIFPKPNLLEFDLSLTPALPPHLIPNLDLNLNINPYSTIFHNSPLPTPQTPPLSGQIFSRQINLKKIYSLNLIPNTLPILRLWLRDLIPNTLLRHGLCPWIWI